MLRLKLFGEFSAAGANDTKIAIKSKKGRALLAYLALSPRRSRSREEIMALLWSDRAEAQARASLRQVLVGLRKDLGEVANGALIVTNDAVALDESSVKVEAGQPGEALLAGFHLHDPAFEDWLRDERLRHEDLPKPEREPSGFHQQDKPSIAVLPFKNKSDDSEQKYFADGLTEDLVTELSRFHEFTVISASATAHYKGKTIDAQSLARELGVRYVVEGSVRRSSQKIRVTAQLIEAENGTQIWAEKYDRGLEDLFAIQDDLTSAVVARLEDRIKVARVTVLRERPTTSMTAYDLILKSRPYRTDIKRESNRKAAELLQQAILADPNCALAHAGLAFVLSGDFEMGWAENPEATLRQAVSAAQRAVALDGADGYCHASLAYVNHLTRDFDGALFEGRRALELNPNHVNIIMTMAWISVVSGEPEAAIEFVERARRLNPTMPGFELWTLGEAYLEARRYQDAIDALLKVPNPPTDVSLELAICYAYLGDIREAQTHLQVYLDRCEQELSSFPGTDPAAWRDQFEQTLPRRFRDDVEHYIEGARRAGLPVK